MVRISDGKGLSQSSLKIVHVHSLGQFSHAQIPQLGDLVLVSNHEEVFVIGITRQLLFIKKLDHVFNGVPFLILDLNLVGLLRRKSMREHGLNHWGLAG